MTEHSGLPVKGYKPQSDENIVLVNTNKEIEERLLRVVDKLSDKYQFDRTGIPNHDARWLAIARTHFEQGFMALNRAIFQPARATLSEDSKGGDASG